MDQNDIPASVKNINLLLLEYLKSSINIILYYRNLYPHDSFAYHQSFKLKVPINRHPDVQNYISQFLNKINTGLLSEIVAIKFAIVDITKADAIVECFNVNLEEYIGNKLGNATGNSIGTDLVIDGLDWYDIYSSFKRNLISLIDNLRCLKEINMGKESEYKFKIFLELYSDGNGNGNELIYDDDDFVGSQNNNGHDTRKLYALNDIDVGYIKFNTCYEVSLGKK
ncbi:hypothetical protein PACTADRAFT_49406 [Pachysolen tannophilus NRRL Y-2460]|uniref:HORMA domain-containing protein n=1 Tax=Pachysolen tannophilus NRRL Y-2460 TaxID=669874 RepID=A0A1E4TW19_PACTA|nr:hypothetical protein PACTADRAFT_49406 [Pachysolen tannophilus NRRL Y-2460]